MKKNKPKLTIKDYCKEFKDRKITLMGLGVLGRGVGDAKFLVDCGAKLTITDLKTKEQLKDSIKILTSDKSLEEDIKFVLGEHREEDFINADLIIKGNGVSLDNKYIKIAKENDVRIAMSVALFAKYAQEVGAIVVGVTGTRGKSTVTQMIYEALRSKASKLGLGNIYIGGNVRGVSTLVLTSKIKKGDVAVLELDSWILQGFGYEEISPHIAVFTNFNPDHLNYYKSMDEYFSDKANIFKYQDESKGDVLIVGGQVSGRIKQDAVHAVMLPSEWKLNVPGEHNRYNAGLAREALQQLGMSDSDIKEKLEEFTGIEGRLEFLGEFGNEKVKIYNDNNATTPEATIAGINALTQTENQTGSIRVGRLILIAGGTDKGTDLKEVARIINEKCDIVHLLDGSGTEKLLPLLKNTQVHKIFVSAVLSAIGDANTGDTILFSPLFSSFGDEFKNEYDRNDKFKKIVEDYYVKE